VNFGPQNPENGVFWAGFLLENQLKTPLFPGFEGQKCTKIALYSQNVDFIAQFHVF